MRIKRLKATNFKSFKDLDVSLGPFNVIIGANASGKSNFVDLLRFLRDIAREGFGNAVSLQGGMDYLRNVQAARDAPVVVEMTIHDEVPWVLSTGMTHKDGMPSFEPAEIHYHLAFLDVGDVKQDWVQYRGRVVRGDPSAKCTPLWEGSVRLSRAEQSPAITPS